MEVGLVIMSIVGMAKYRRMFQGLDESPPHGFRELIRLQAIAIPALEKSTKLLEEANIGIDLPGDPCQNTSTVYTCNLENITAGADSRRTMFLEVTVSVRARNIITGNGSAQLIGRLSDVTLQKIA